jgi:hypothetical protein
MKQDLLAPEAVSDWYIWSYLGGENVISFGQDNKQWPPTISNNLLLLWSLKIKFWSLVIFDRIYTSFVVVAARYEFLVYYVAGIF